MEELWQKQTDFSQLNFEVWTGGVACRVLQQDLRLSTNTLRKSNSHKFVGARALVETCPMF